MQERQRENARDRERQHKNGDRKNVMVPSQRVCEKDGAGVRRRMRENETTSLE